jgi:diaminohydroxyphosphoribosylaminopyrimidine deaminase/5-amino-6-(5-phosphoribosylamino)uracil reductase
VLFYTANIAILMPMNFTLKPGFSLGGRIDRTLLNSVTPLCDADVSQSSDEYWMELALIESMNAVGWSAPNPAVGCVIVRENKMIASGFTQAYKKEHAERMAFAQIKNQDDLIDATVYVTLEPCTHFGNQPPCVDLLVASPIRRVVIACADPDARVSGQGIEKLKLAGKEVIVGVLGDEAQAWHFPFLKNRLTSKPIWVGKWAQTPSGHLADSEGNSKWVTNAESRAYTHWLRQKYDAILVGAGTWICDRPALTVRDCALPHRRNPARLVFDPKGKLATLSLEDLLIHRASPVYVYIEKKFYDVLKQTLPQDQLLRWISFEAQGSDLISSFVKAVESTEFEKPLQSIFCEGGATLLNLLLQHSILDAVHQFTGTKCFKSVDSRHRVKFEHLQTSVGRWFCAINHQFQDDDLREWVKCF